MKKISIMIPCYNEVENVELMAMAVTNVLQETLSRYDYEILFIDNCSTDGTRDKLERICAENKKIKAIFNVTNFGQFNSPFYRTVPDHGGLCDQPVLRFPGSGGNAACPCGGVGEGA